MNIRKQELHSALESTRARTLHLLDSVPEDFLKVRVHDFYSPIGWHFGHVGMTEEFWVCREALRGSCLDDKLSFLFANLPDNPKDSRVHLPSRAEIIAYLAETRSRVLAALADADLTSDEPLLADGYAWEFALQHECQHQETIAEMLHLIQKYSGIRTKESPSPLCSAQAVTEMVTIPGGTFVMGSNDRHGYDNEKTAHPVEVASFELDRTPVTVAQWLAFIADGGYERHELWRDAGFFEWRLPEGIDRPDYWLRTDNGRGYLCIGPQGPRSMVPDEPVSGISWYEADAYARWAGKRLPTEAEWEYAAAYDPESGQSRRFPWGNEAPTDAHAAHGLSAWAPGAVGSHPQGQSALGLLDMAGGVWEWTASPFLPYPGFEAFPYDGYSKEHMDGKHFVCRGGSWATAGPILRCSFRNWYVPTYRQGFLGLRCAR